MNWGLSGRCDFPSVSPLRRHETSFPVELLGCSSRRNINCFIRTVMLSAEGMGRGQPLLSQAPKSSCFKG